MSPRAHCWTPLFCKASAIARHQATIQGAHLHQVRHLAGIGLTQVTLIQNEPHLVACPLRQLAQASTAQPFGQMGRIHLRPLRALSFGEANNPLCAVLDRPKHDRVGGNALAYQAAGADDASDRLRRYATTLISNGIAKVCQIFASANRRFMSGSQLCRLTHSLRQAIMRFPSRIGPLG